ncbi:MAG TPA: N-acetylmuramoyl-L-alanine amidase [Rhodocyclaceae bacterium]|nr:N-acetylmuramoyl-L-alanine amidase [Rhodocyclaceae bacterium]
MPAPLRFRPARTLATALAALLVAACTTAPPHLGTGLPAAWRGSPNFDERHPNLVILHHTSDDTVDEAMATLTTAERKVSAHYLVGRDGRIYQLVDERARAWHAGVSYWGGQTDINSASIGIELDNNGFEPYSEPQIATLLALLADLKARYNIPTANFIGHADVAPGRKDDPNGLFPWRRLAESGFGLWCDAPYPAVPETFDLTTGLMALGYNPANPASLTAFRTHFVPPAQPGESELGQTAAILYCLVQRKAAS